jgi:hypothetical protein
VSVKLEVAEIPKQNTFQNNKVLYGFKHGLPTTSINKSSPKRFYSTLEYLDTTLYKVKMTGKKRNTSEVHRTVVG